MVRRDGRTPIGTASYIPRAARADFTKPLFCPNFSIPLRSTLHFTSPCGPHLARQWLDRVAANPRFLFTAKLWQKFTHEPATTAQDEAAVRAGFDVLRDAGKLGAILMQFPFSFHNTPENLARLETICLRAFSDYPLAVEVRHSTWAQKSFYRLLHERGVGFCNIDQPVIGNSIKPAERATSSIGYVRLHGRRYDTWFTNDPAVPSYERYNYLYSLEELEPWAERIKTVSAHAEKTFVITNNHFQGKGVVNALELIRLVTGNKVKVPEPLRHHYPRLESIADEPSQEPMLFPDPTALVRAAAHTRRKCGKTDSKLNKLD